jgi:hypothetical protein
MIAKPSETSYCEKRGSNAFILIPVNTKVMTYYLSQGKLLIVIPYINPYDFQEMYSFVQY